MGPHMTVNFYLHPKIDPKDYGFEECEDSHSRERYWYLKFGYQSSAIIIDGITRKIHCNGVSSKCMAVLFKIAEQGGIEIEDDDAPKRIRMSLTEEEYLKVQEMRNHPKEEEE